MNTQNRARMERLISIAGPLLFLLLLLLAGCQGAPATATPVAPQAAPATTTAATPSATQAASAPSPATTTGPASTPGGSVLRIALQPIAQTDPALISSDSEIMIANQVYDYLLDIDPENNVKPRLATDWQISDDGLTYTFTLASGVAFHDGSPFSAKDVVWTYNRLRDPQSGYPTADLYQEISDIQAAGDLTVTFTLSQTNPFFLYDLSDNHALMLKADTANPGQDFNGTGPFVVTSYNPGDRIIMQANKGYFISAEPKVDGLEAVFYSDTSAAVNALQGGQLDFVMQLSTQLYNSLKQQSGVKPLEAKTNAFVDVRLRMDEKPGNDPRVIQAFNLATDREAIFKLVQQGYGYVGRSGPIGPIFKDYYDPNLKVPARDPAAARKLLSEAGYPDGLKMDFYLLNSGNFPDLAAALKQQWAEAGIDVNIQLEPESVFYGEGKWLSVDLGATGWGHRPYPQFYLDVMLVCNAKWNEARFCDPAFDKLVATAGTSMDMATRVQAYHEIQKTLIEKGPLIVPYFFSQLAATSERVQGLTLNPFPGRTDFRSVALTS